MICRKVWSFQIMSCGGNDEMKGMWWRKEIYLPTKTDGLNKNEQAKNGHIGLDQIQHLKGRAVYAYI